MAQGIHKEGEQSVTRDELIQVKSPSAGDDVMMITRQCVRQIGIRSS